MLLSLVYITRSLPAEILLVRGWSEARLRVEVLALRHQLRVLQPSQAAALAASTGFWRIEMD